MKKILLVSHGLLAMGTMEAVRMIAWKCDDMDYLCLSGEKDIDTFRRELDSKLDLMKDADQIVVIADLLGGSPYHTVLSLLDEKGMMDQSFVMTGLNLPLAVSVALSQDDVTREMLEGMLEEVKKGITLFEPMKIEDEDDEL